MSFQVANIDVSGAVVGQQFQIPLGKNVVRRLAPSFNQRPNDDIDTERLRVFNESHVGLLLQWGDNAGSQHTLIAGGQATIPIPPNEGVLIATVQYVIPNPVVTSLIATYYAPGEKIPDTGLLGNSPVGGGVVSTAFQSKELVTNDVTEAIFLDNTLLANTVNFIPTFIPSNTNTTIDLAFFAQKAGVSSPTVNEIMQSDVANNQLKLLMHLLFPVGGTNIGGFKIMTGTGAGTFTHGVGITPAAVCLIPTQAAEAWFTGGYTTTQFTIGGITGTHQWIAVLYF